MYSSDKIKKLAVGSIVAALYFVVTIAIAPFSFGAIQFRLSETLNHLAMLNKRYIVPVTLGCLIANLFSPLGVYDLAFGTSATLVFLSLSYFIAKRFQSIKVRFAINCGVMSILGMLPITAELMIVYHLPFLMTYITCAAGELVSMIVGAFIVYAINKKFPLAHRI